MHQNLDERSSSFGSSKFEGATTHGSSTDSEPLRTQADSLFCEIMAKVAMRDKLKPGGMDRKCWRPTEIPVESAAVLIEQGKITELPAHIAVSDWEGNDTSDAFSVELNERRRSPLGIHEMPLEPYYEKVDIPVSSFGTDPYGSYSLKVSDYDLKVRHYRIKSIGNSLPQD